MEVLKLMKIPGLPSPGYVPFFSISVAAALKSAGFTESRPKYLFVRVRYELV